MIAGVCFSMHVFILCDTVFILPIHLNGLLVSYIVSNEDNCSMCMSIGAIIDIDRYIIRVAESILLNPLEEVCVRAHVYVGKFVFTYN